MIAQRVVSENKITRPRAAAGLSRRACGADGRVMGLLGRARIGSIAHGGAGAGEKLDGAARLDGPTQSLPRGAARGIDARWREACAARASDALHATPPPSTTSLCTVEYRISHTEGDFRRNPATQSLGAS